MHKYFRAALVGSDEAVPVVDIVPFYSAGSSCVGRGVGGCSSGARGLRMTVVQRFHQLGDLAGEARDLAGQSSQHGVKGWEVLVWLASHPGG